jgi:hypothetical protein
MAKGRSKADVQGKADSNAVSGDKGSAKARPVSGHAKNADGSPDEDELHPIFGRDPTSRSLINLTYEGRLDATDNIIYHYCSAETLRIIVKNRTLRFSDALCLNDGEEIAWANRQLDLAIKRLVDRDRVGDDIPAVSRSFLASFGESLESVRQLRRHFVASFSTTGDSLSQWRAYADDAQGFAVGFCVNDVDVPAAFWQIEYDIEKQQSEIISYLAEMFRLSKRSDDYFEHQIHMDVFYFFLLLSRYKNPAFVDEREVRGVHVVALQHSKTGQSRFEFVGGGIANIGEVKEGDINYRVSSGRLVPFIDFPFQIGSPCALREVWMGPRCATPEEDLARFIHTMGLDAVQVRRAGSSYRG